jgi:fatty acid desaturase
MVGSPAMTLAATSLLTREELAQVRKRSDVRGILLVAHAYGVIFGCMALMAAVPSPIVWAIGIVLVGARQLGLAVLMHDAAHGVLTNDKKLNDVLGQVFCAWPVITDMYLYRTYHLQHHRWTQQKNDPDLGLSAPFPITAQSLERKVVRDLTGQTTLKQRLAQFRSALGKPGQPLAARAQNFLRRLGGPLLINAILLGALSMIGYGWLYLALWVVPFFTWFPMITRIRNIAEHAVVPDDDDPFRNARTTKAGWLMRAALAPYWVNYHVEHHLLMFVPCYNLPRMHELLIAKGFGPKMEIQPDYWTVLRLAASKPAGATEKDEAPAEPGNNHGAGLAFNVSPRAGMLAAAEA